MRKENVRKANSGEIMIYEIGQYNTLRVLRETDFGYYLGEADDSILLPKAGLTRTFKVDELVDVFVYTDSEDRPIATTASPKAVAGDIVCLEVVDVNRFGAFLDLGLSKDILLPFGRQRRRYKVGEKVVVKILLDKVTERLVASTKLAAQYDPASRVLKNNQKVDVTVLDRYDRGMRVLVDGKYAGLIYHNEIIKPLEIGDSFAAYISEIRPDGKLDISLKPKGQAAVGGDKELILEKLKQENGFLPYNAKTDSSEIKEFFGLSKKAFKKALGALYKERIVEITEDGMKLTDK